MTYKGLTFDRGHLFSIRMFLKSIKPAEVTYNRMMVSEDWSGSCWKLDYDKSADAQLIYCGQLEIHFDKTRFLQDKVSSVIFLHIFSDLDELLHL